MTDQDGPVPVPIRYEVSAVPDGNPERRHAQLFVDRLGVGQWTVGVGDDVTFFDRDGVEYVGARHQNDWYTRFVMPLSQALDLARRVAPTLTCGGYTVEQLTAMGEQQLRARETRSRGQ